MRCPRRTFGTVTLTLLLLALSAAPAWADADHAPAGGAAAEEIVLAGVVGAVLAAAVAALTLAHLRGRLVALDRLAAFAGRTSGLPGWAALPLAVAGGSLLIAVFGFYWDVATHIDHGRDAGPFANPSHWWIIVGLLGLALAGILSDLLGTGDDDVPSALSIRGRRVPAGGLLLLGCSLVALVGFPIDDVWHRIFGQDVTLWSPPHIQMVAGASLTTIAMWMLSVEGQRAAGAAGSPRRRGRVRFGEVALAGAVLVGMSTLQGEFDYGVPQFRLLYQPVLIAVAAGIALVPARMRLGRGGALLAVGFFLALRGALSLVISGGFEHVTFHFPLYLGAAIAIEAVARWVPTGRPVPFGAWSGAGIATLGLAVEWGWSHVWMPHPWPATLLPEVVLVAVPAAVAAAVVGGYLGRALTDDPSQPSTVGARWVAPLATAVLVAAIAYPLPRATADVSAHIQLEEVADGPDRHVHATVRLDPPDAADDAEWLTAIAWQGAEWWSDETTLLDHLEPAGDGEFVTTVPIPVHGEWKSLVRLHDGRVMVAAPLYLPEDPAIPASEVPADDEARRPFVADSELLLREARPAPGWLTTTAYAAMAAIAAAWIASLAWGTRRLRSERREPGEIGHPVRSG